MKKIIILSVLFFSLASCTRIKNGAKNGIAAAGEIVGEGSSAFVDGVSKGVEDRFECTVSLQKKVEAAGVKQQKFEVRSDSAGQRNTLAVYLIFETHFNQDVTVRVTDAKGLEYGRLVQNVSAVAGEARFVDFKFDKRTSLESKSHFILE